MPSFNPVNAKKHPKGCFFVGKSHSSLGMRTYFLAFASETTFSLARWLTKRNKNATLSGGVSLGGPFGFCPMGNIPTRAPGEQAPRRLLMMHRLWRYDDFATRKMICFTPFAMMRCLPIKLGEAGIISDSVIIGATNIICRRQTSLKKARFRVLFSWWAI